MNFTTTYQSGGRFLAIFFGGILVVLPPAVILLFQMNVGVIAAFAPFAIVFSLLFLGLKLSYIKTEIKISDSVLTIGKEIVSISEIRSYYLRNLTPRVNVLDLTLKSGKELSVTGLNYGTLGAPMNQFVAAMRARFERAIPPIELIESEGALKIKRYRRRWRAGIKVTIAFALACDVFMLAMIVLGYAQPRHFLPLIAPNLIIPYLFACLGRLK